MSQLIEKVKELGIPTNLDIRAANFIMSDETGSEYHLPVMGRQSIVQYVDKMNHLVGDLVNDIEFSGVKHARVLFGYLVCEIINNPEAAEDTVFETATKKTEVFFKRFNWTTKDAYERSSDTTEATPAQKSTKNEIFEEFKKHDFDAETRDEIVDAVAKNVTAARSSLVNYYYTYRKSNK